MKKYILTIISLVISLSAFSQEVNWIGLQEAFEMQAKNPKPILIDVYTDWCGWCKRMEKTTYRDPQIVQYLNTNFYAVKYNAETHDTIAIQGKQYTNSAPKGSKGTHSFAKEVGARSYPTTLLYDKNGQNRSIAAGALKPDQMVPLLVFFGEHLVGMSDINTFSTDFNRTYKPDSTQLKNDVNIEWLDIDKGLELVKTQKKKLWIQTYDDNCLTCKVMDSTIYKNKYLVDYINENYIPIKLNAFHKDTITLQGKDFINPNNALNSYHQLFTAALTNQELKSPALLLFDENEQMITPVRSFMNVKYAEALAVYFYENKHKENVNFGEFIKTHDYKSVTTP